jgi:hypothetical protein
MLHDFKKPDLSAPRFRKETPTILNREFYSTFRKAHPEVNLTNKQIREIISIAGDLFQEKVIERRDGVELPEQLGHIFIGSTAETKSGNIDYKRSIELGKKVRHKNYETDGLTAKIFYTNFGSNYRFRFHKLWKFKPVRQFSERVGKTYPEKYAKYIRVECTMKISHLFRS